MKEVGLTVVREGEDMGLCISRNEPGFARGRSIEVLVLTKDEALLLSRQLAHMVDSHE